MMYPRLLTTPEPKQGDPSRHVFEVAFYATPEAATAGKDDWLVVEWFECNYLRAIKQYPVLDVKGDKIGEVPGDGKPEKDIEDIIARWLAVPANLRLRGDLRKGLPPPAKAAIDPHGVKEHPKVAAMRGKPERKP